MYKKLEKWAVDEFRSTNGQIEWILNKALKEAGRLKDEKKIFRQFNQTSD